MKKCDLYFGDIYISKAVKGEIGCGLGMFTFPVENQDMLLKKQALLLYRNGTFLDLDSFASSLDLICEQAIRLIDVFNDQAVNISERPEMNRYVAIDSLIPIYDMKKGRTSIKRAKQIIKK